MSKQIDNKHFIYRENQFPYKYLYLILNEIPIFIIKNMWISFVFAYRATYDYWGLYPDTVLSNHSWKIWGISWYMGDLTQVEHIQNKYPFMLHCLFLKGKILTEKITVSTVITMAI